MEQSPNRFLVVFLKTQGHKTLMGFADALGQHAGFKVVKANNGEEAAAWLTQDAHGLLFFDIREPAQLNEAIRAIQKCHGLITQSCIKVVGQIQLAKQNDKAMHTLMKLGCQDWIDDAISQRALTNKFDRLVKVSVTAYHKAVQKAGSAEALRFKAADAKTPKKSSEKTIEWAPPMAGARDIWLLQHIDAVKNRMGKWIIEMVGYPPSYGKWTSFGKLWVWSPRNSVAQEASAGGKWIFQGKQPEFIWRDHLWQFIGENATLYFEKIDGTKALRLEGNLNSMQIAKNHQDAEATLGKFLQQHTDEKKFAKEELRQNGLEKAAEKFQFDPKTPPDLDRTVQFKMDEETTKPLPPDYQSNPKSRRAGEIKTPDLQAVPAPATPAGSTALASDAASNPPPQGPGSTAAPVDQLESNGADLILDQTLGEMGLPVEEEAVDWGVRLRDWGLKVTMEHQTPGSNELKNYKAKIVDFFESEVSLEVWDSDIEVGDSVKVLVQMADSNPPFDFVVEGMVESIDEAVVPEKKILNLFLGVFDYEVLTAFQEKFAERQQDIKQFLDKAKGAA